MFCDDTVLNKLLTHLIKIIFKNDNYGCTTELLVVPSYKKIPANKYLPDFWCYGIIPIVILEFFNNLLHHKFGYMYFRYFLRYNQKYKN